MSYQEKRNITNITAMALVLASYCVYAFSRYTTQNSLREWAVTMLVFMGIGIIVMVVVQVLFHIFFAVGIAVREAVNDENVKESKIEESMELEMVEDERDRLIGLKSMRAGFITSGLGVIGALISLVLNFTPTVMLNILYISFFIGSIAEGIVNLVYYRQGITHG